MLSAKRKSDGLTVTAYSESKANAPFFCLVCGDEVALKTGRYYLKLRSQMEPYSGFPAQNITQQNVMECRLKLFLP